MAISNDSARDRSAIGFVVRFANGLLREINSSPKKCSIFLLSILTITEVGFIANGQWVGDFWEHCAVLRELIRDPMHPQHPVIASSLPHAFFSPYLVALGFVGHITSWSAIDILSMAAFFNFALWFAGLFFLVKSFYPDTVWRVFFYLVFFHLFCWGPIPWIYSSFFHFNSLHYVLPYPSTFCAAVVFFCGYLFSRYLKEPSPFLLITVVVLNLIVLLTHPTTFLFSMALLTALLMKENALRQWWAALMVMIIPFLFAFIWPYFPFYDLVFAAPGGSQFHLRSEVLYQSVPVRLAPALLILMVLKRDDVREAKSIAVLLIILFAIYAYGLFSKNYGYGRVISFMVLFLHLLVAVKFGLLSSLGKREMTVAVLTFLLCLPFGYYTVKTFYSDFPFLAKSSYASYVPMERYLSINEIVLADENTIRYVPAFGGKVTASVFPPYWIEDNEDRLNDLKTFFSSDDPRTLREIISKYKAGWVVFDPKKKVFSEDMSRTLGLEVRYNDGEVALYKVNASYIAPGE